MNLHRTTGKPDWEEVKPSNRNAWQTLGARTNGWVTPGNIITVVGFGLVIWSLVLILDHHYISGLILLVIGRGFDLLDGIAAQSTGTKSPLGEAFDATFDKLGTVATLGMIVVARFAPWWIIALLLLPQLYVTLLSLYLIRHGRRLHPSKLGKLSMAAAWLGLFGLVFSVSSKVGIASLLTYAIILISILMGTAAAIGYTKEAK